MESASFHRTVIREGWEAYVPPSDSYFRQGAFAMMDAAALVALREDLRITQMTMASRLGLSLRAFQNLESGETPIRRIHENALRSVLVAFAIERKDISLLGSDQAALAGLVLGEFAQRMGYSSDQRQQIRKVMQLAA